MRSSQPRNTPASRAPRAWPSPARMTAGPGRRPRRGCPRSAGRARTAPAGAAGPAARAPRDRRVALAAPAARRGMSSAARSRPERAWHESTSSASALLPQRPGPPRPGLGGRSAVAWWPFRGPGRRTWPCLRARQVVSATVERSEATSSCVASPNSPAANRLARSSSFLIVPPTPTAFIATFMTRGSPMTRDTRGSLMRRIARPTTTSLTVSNIDIAGCATQPTLASTRPSRHARRVLARVAARLRRSAASSPARSCSGGCSAWRSCSALAPRPRARAGCSSAASAT